MAASTTEMGRVASGDGCGMRRPDAPTRISRDDPSAAVGFQGAERVSDLPGPITLCRRSRCRASAPSPPLIVTS